MQRKQATGIDTRMMLPVYAGIFGIICQLFLPWLSIPVLRYSGMKPAYSIFRMDACIAAVQQCVEGGGKLPMEPLTPEEIAVLSGVGQAVRIAGILVAAALLGSVVMVFWKRSRSVGAVRSAAALQIFWTVVQFALVLGVNLFFNGRMGRVSDFTNLTIHSYVQLTSWVYAQMFTAIAICIAAGKLLRVDREEKPECYVERTMQEDHRIGRRTWVAMALIVIAIPLVIFFGIYFLNDRSSVFIGLCIVCLAMLPFAMVFENRRPQARELLLIAVMAAIAVVGRWAFFMVPQFKPTAAIVIIAGIGLGSEAGFLTGAMAGFVSNFLFGQGPWTPWQMFAFGIIGFLAGLLFPPKKKREKKGIHLLALCAYGGISVLVIYGLVMDFSAVVTAFGDFTKEAFIARIISGFAFNMIHAVATVIFLFFLADPMERKLNRIKKKYGIMEV